MRVPAKDVLRTKTLRQKARVALRLGHHLEGPDDLTLDQRLDKRELGGRIWIVEGKALAKNQVVAYALEEMVGGLEGLPRICARPGMPTFKTFMGWLNHNPEWKKALREAEEMKAYVHEDEALRRARVSGGDMAQVKGDELFVKTSIWAAERANRKRFSEKPETEVADGLASATDDQLVAKIVAAVMAVPVLLERLAPKLKQVLSAEKFKEVEDAALAARSAGAVEGEVVEVEVAP